MKYFLGIDGGGTKTKVVIINNEKEVIYEKVSGPSSIDTVDSEGTLNSFLEALKDFKEQITLTSVFAGLGGIVSNEDKQNVISIIKKLPLVNENTKVVAENDMHNALYSGLLFNEGMTLIAGTGMVAFGKDLSGKSLKCGGWGFKEGDSGSGYSLGRSAYRYLVRTLDGRYEKDDFSKDLENSLNLKGIENIIETMDELYLNRTKVASLAPIVTKHANNGNPFAIKIIEEETNELALAVNGVYNQLNLNNKTLVIVGTLGNIDGLFKTRLHEKIKEIDKDIKIIAPQVDPAIAAALMAFNL